MRFVAKFFSPHALAILVFSGSFTFTTAHGNCPLCGHQGDDGPSCCGNSDALFDQESCTGGGCDFGDCPTCDGAACGCFPGALGARGDRRGSVSNAERLFGGGQRCGTGGRLFDSLRNSMGTVGLVGCQSCGNSDCNGAVVHCGMAAPQYPAPFPTPKPTTWTEFTYPPFMPHNSLPHYRGSYSFRHAPGLSRTNVMWTPTKLQNALDRLHNAFEIPR